MQLALEQWLAPGKVFYDVGANVGFFCLVASQLIGPSGKIVAFEAEPDVAARLRHTIRRNGLPGVTVVEAAVWSETGAVEFDRGIGSPDRMVGRVVERPGRAEEGCVSVPAITLDDFTRSAPVPDVVKCDVEGAESHVLQGATELFDRVRPCLLCEVHDSANERFLREWLEKRGYSFRWLEPGDQFPRHLSAEPQEAAPMAPPSPSPSSGPAQP